MRKMFCFYQTQPFSFPGKKLIKSAPLKKKKFYFTKNKSVGKYLDEHL